MLEDVQNVCSRDKRALPDAALTPESTTADLISWLSSFLRPRDIKQLQIKEMVASKLLLMESQEVRKLRLARMHLCCAIVEACCAAIPGTQTCRSGKAQFGYISIVFVWL